MPSLLIKVFGYLLESTIKRLFSGAGITLAVATGIYQIAQNLINDGISTLNTAPALMLNLVGLSGLDVALSLIIGALLARATIMQAQLFLAKSGV